MSVEDSVAEDMLRSGYERWYRLEEEKAAIGEDLKQLFAELKGNGFTPKALRESFRRVRNINDASQQEHDATVDLYVAALTGARPAPARVGNIEEFPVEHDEDGVILEDEQQVAPQPASDLTAPLSPQGQVAPIQPETANEARDESGHVAADAAGHGPVEADAETHLKGGENVDTPDGPATPAFDGATNSTGTPGKSGGAQASSAPPTNISTFAGKPLRPHCLNPGNKCGGQGRNHCWSCTKAMNEAGAA